MTSSSKRKEIGLFFGSFNPIHVGHLIIANHIRNFSFLDQIWLVVSPQNPLKEKSSLARDYDRLRMVELAIGDSNFIKSSNIEFFLPKPSYTIDTLVYLKEKHPDKNFTLIMGADNISTIDKWKNYQELISNYKILVYKRPGSIPKLPETLSDFNKNIEVIDAPLLDISSTFIRGLVASNKSYQYFVPEPVRQYIEELGLYLKL
jgi:nicotinate-nucleotide adenylyltransferase